MGRGSANRHEGRVRRHATMLTMAYLMASLLVACDSSRPISSPSPLAATRKATALASTDDLPDASGSPDSPHPTEAVDAVLIATATYPLVGLGEVHLNQEFHDFLGELLPKLPSRVDDVVVEVGGVEVDGVERRGRFAGRRDGGGGGQLP